MSLLCAISDRAAAGHTSCREVGCAGSLGSIVNDAASLRRETSRHHCLTLDHTTCLRPLLSVISILRAGKQQQQAARKQQQQQQASQRCGCSGGGGRMERGFAAHRGAALSHTRARAREGACHTSRISVDFSQYTNTYQFLLTLSKFCQYFPSFNETNTATIRMQHA